MNDNDDAHMKEAQLQIREFEEKDYRGLLSLTLIVGYILSILATVILRPEYLSYVIACDTPVILALDYYFKRLDK